jgi:hypothetical protein
MVRRFQAADVVIQRPRLSTTEPSLDQCSPQEFVVERLPATSRLGEVSDPDACTSEGVTDRISEALDPVVPRSPTLACWLGVLGTIKCNALALLREVAPFV